MDSNKDAPLFLAGQLVELLRARAKAETASWLQAQLERASRAESRSDLFLAFASAGRRLGTSPLPAEDVAKLGPDVALQLAGRGLDEVARAALVLAANDKDTVNELYLRGDAREKQAVLRALPLLPEPARFLELGVDAVRSSVQTVFEAIACETSYPAQFFTDAQLNQLVLKALFNEVPVARIAGLERRVQPELVRMALGYAAERRAAGRAVPQDIDWIVATASRRSA